jgi:hypothetical protein
VDVSKQPDEARRGSRPPREADAISGMKAIADIQADGLRAASELLDRVLGRDRPVPPSPDAAGEGDYAPLLDAWASLLERFAAGLARPDEQDAALVRIDSEAVGPTVRIRFADGESSEAEICLYNAASEAAGPLRLVCSALTGPDGASLAGAEVSFAPREIEELPAGSSAGVVVSLRAERPPRTGVYRGTVQAPGAPSLWLPVEVTVEPC